MFDKILSWLKCGICTIVGLLAGAVLTIPMITIAQGYKIDPNWFQAIASVGAIAAAVAIAAYQGRENLRHINDERNRRAEALANERLERREAVREVIAPALSKLRALEIDAITLKAAGDAKNLLEKLCKRLELASSTSAKDLRTAAIVARISALPEIVTKKGLGAGVNLDLGVDRSRAYRVEAKKQADEIVKEADALLRDL